MPLFALAFGLMALLVAGFLYVKVQAESVITKHLTTSVSEMRGTVDRIDETVAVNRTEMLEMRQEVGTMTKRFDQLRRESLLSELKSQGAVLKALSGNLKEPMRTRTLSLAEQLAAF